MAELQYKTFDQLMATVREDLHQYDDNSLIVERRCIKEARRCNSTLGLKLNEKRGVTLDINRYRTDIPEDLLSVIAMVAYPATTAGYCIPRPTRKALGCFCSNTLNKYKASNIYQVDKDDDQFVYNFSDGTVDVAYIAHMEDEEGNLLVLDHPLTNNYYEWAMKEKIFTDLWHNKNADVYNMLQDARMQHSLAKQRAVQIVTTPEYRVLRDSARKAELEFYNQYIKMFS